MIFWRVLWSMVGKDLRIEWRTKQLFISSLSFALLLVFLMGLVLYGSSNMTHFADAGLLWLLIMMAGLFSLNRQDDKERWDGAIYGAAMVPTDRSVLFYARVMSHLLFVVVMEVVLVPLYSVVLGTSIQLAWGPIILVLLMGTLGFVAVGALLTSLALTSSLREILVPIMIFPLSVPLLLGAVEVTSSMLQGNWGKGVWWAVIGAYDILFLVLPGLLYDFIAEV